MNCQQSIVDYVNFIADTIEQFYDIPVYTERSIDVSDDIFAIVHTNDMKPFEFLNETNDKQLVIYPIVQIKYKLQDGFYESQAVDYAKDMEGILTEQVNSLYFQSIESGFDIDSQGSILEDRFITILKFKAS